MCKTISTDRPSPARAPAAWPHSMRSATLKPSRRRPFRSSPTIPLSEDDRSLFRKAAAGATPVNTDKHPSVLAKPKPLPIPRQRNRDEYEALQESRLSDFTSDTLLDTDEALSFTRNGVSSDTLRRLRRGHWTIQAELDLHGLRTDEAREVFAAFIRDCQKRDRRCVRVIHGKGLGSVGGEPVLKNKVKAWLMQKDEVLAFCQASAHEGGSGAVVVLLRASS
ncbi:MAG: DNA mismatch repair protein MutS [Betaproteobacteria bacterium]|nr:DNA mismatch repair protein MutS [Betaproteobacteria bacterium]NDF03721.1 DNA mismatch repair protein MutS [Betaproteobacteria bacterium]